MLWQASILFTLSLSLALGTGLFSTSKVLGFEFESQVQNTTAELVSRLNLESYKDRLKGLAQFGDRRQGTDRNRQAVDWIEEQLESYGCSTNRLHYEYYPLPRRGNTRRSNNLQIFI